MSLLVKYVVFITVAHYVSAENCLSRDYYNGGTVCVCNSDHCDTLPPIISIQKNKYIKVTSNKAGLRFKKEEGDFAEKKSISTNVVQIGAETYQEIIGFGGAFTDATGINIKSLNEELQDKLIRAYFSDQGLEYSIGRVPIGGTDFSLEPYSYCDTVDDVADPNLSNFGLKTEDYELKIPFIQKALNLTKNNLDLFASAWIAPNWMKTKPGFTAKLSFLKQEMYQPWADYFVKFLDAYKENNISIWGITTGNEPLTAIAPKKIPSVAWTPQSMIKWIKENLGPTLRNSNYSDIKILTLDDQRILLPLIVEQIFSDELAKKYVDGIGVHWYVDFLTSPDVLTNTHNKYPDKFILATEGCNGFLFGDVSLGNWDRAEYYADNILQDLNHWVIGWTDWNMALNLQGGPTFINNLVDSPIIVNALAGEFYKQPMFYALGHFSKFFPKGSVRVKSTTFDNTVPVTAVRRPDGGTAIVILNKNNQDISITVRDSTRGDIDVDLSSKSITSIVYW